ncbi:MAG TPA: CBS domain-containing protein [Patescibacteria group bacterium]|jgi:CBS domain containing-hemolysin-like protein|nr:CBS domain-containing protein [Patescibacteria group bacterium]
MLVIIIALLALLFALASVRPNRTHLTDFELRRRLDAKHDGALLEWRRAELHAELMTLRRILIAFVLVLVSALLIAEFGWGWGLLLALIVTVFYNRVARFVMIRTLSQRFYNSYESQILQFVESYQRFIRPLAGISDGEPERKITSREELEHQFSELKDVLSVDERHMLSGVLHFDEKIVKDYMTPRSVMEAIGANELLGPLVLDNLHRTGHTHFPVFEGDIDHLVGILHIYSLFTLENKKSLAVKDAMEPRVYYINETQTLEQALFACIKHRRHLLVVVNNYRETVGVITIEDAVEQLIGRKIVDQFAEHDDLRKVAERNPRHNNSSEAATDV